MRVVSGCSKPLMKGVLVLQRHVDRAGQWGGDDPSHDLVLCTGIGCHRGAVHPPGVYDARVAPHATSVVQLGLRGGVAPADSQADRLIRPFSDDLTVECTTT